MNYCKKCGAEISSRYCPKCGYDNNDKSICPNCKSELNGRFCGSCGYDTKKAQKAQKPPRTKQFNFKEFIKKHKKVIMIIGASLLSFVLVTAVVALIVAYFSNIFRIGKISKIDIGMSVEQVEKILGEPSEKSESGSTYYWYEKKIAKKIAKAEKAENDLEESLDFENEEKFESALEKIDKLWAEIEESTFKCITIKFDGDEKVESVFYNKKSKYDEPISSYEKEVKNAKLEIESLNASEITIDGETTFEISREYNDIPYTVKYKDGSYYLSSINAYSLTLSKEDKDFYVSWEDVLGEYSVKKNINFVYKYGVASDTLTSYYSNEENVIIPSSITMIGTNAFKGNTTIKSITIPERIKVISNSAFSGCTSLTEIKFNATNMDDLEENNYVFSNAGKNGNGIRVTIGKNVTNVPAYLFYPTNNVQNSPKITSVTFEEGSVCENIGSYAFSSCSSLTSVTIGEGVTSIGRYAFYDCKALTEINFNAMGLDDLSYGNFVFSNAGKNGNGIKVTIGKNVTKIPACLFYPSYNSSFSPKIISVEFEEGSVCESIGSSAFRDCTSLTSVTIPNCLTSIGNYAFDDCASLRYNEYDNAYYLGNEDNPYIVLIKAKDASITSCIINENTKVIYDYAFSGCNKLVEVYNLSSLKITTGSSSNGHVGYYAKVIHTSLDEESILETVDDYIFMTWKDKYYLMGYVGNDKELTLPKIYNGNNYEIYKYAFYSCTGLTSVTIGEGVTSIGYLAFKDCTALTEIKFNATAMEDLASNYLVFANAGTNDDGITVTIGKNVTKIPDNLFNSIYIDDYGEVFDYPPKITSVNYLGTIEQWCNISFGNFSANPLNRGANLYISGELVTNLVIPDTVTEIKDNAFSGCTSLTSVTIGDSVTSIGKHAFDNCTSLTSVTIGNGATKIGGDAFANCTSLTSITIPNSVTSIGHHAFSNRGRISVYCEATHEPNGWNIDWSYSSNGHVYVCWYSENEPTGDGNYWHYVDGEIVVWE